MAALALVVTAAGCASQVRGQRLMGSAQSQWKAVDAELRKRIADHELALRRRSATP